MYSIILTYHLSALFNTTSSSAFQGTGQKSHHRLASLKFFQKLLQNVCKVSEKLHSQWNKRIFIMPKSILISLVIWMLAPVLPNHCYKIWPNICGKSSNHFTSNASCRTKPKTKQKGNSLLSVWECASKNIRKDANQKFHQQVRLHLVPKIFHLYHCFLLQHMNYNVWNGGITKHAPLWSKDSCLWREENATTLCNFAFKSSSSHKGKLKSRSFLQQEYMFNWSDLDLTLHATCTDLLTCHNVEPQNLNPVQNKFCNRK